MVWLDRLEWREEMAVEMLRLLRNIGFKPRAGRSSARSTSKFSFALVAALVHFISSAAHAGITTYGNGQREVWFEDVGDVGGAEITMIGFSEFPHGTSITDQYRDDGLVFDGNNFTQGPSCGIYPQDCFGLRGLLDIAFEFDSPRNAIAVDYPGDVRFLLYFGSDFVGEHYFGTAESGNFAGVISATPFDSVVFNRFGVDPVFVDDIHFAFIPSPGGMIPLLLFCFVRRHGRRRTERFI